MELCLLGPVEALDGDRPLPLGGAKQRALLAILVLNANEVVSADRLIDELWGERPPETAATGLQVYVSRLRKVLPEGMLVTRSPGYVLQLDPECVDVHRFERLVADARADAPPRAAERLREALGLWRGAPLADLAYEPFAQAEIARLEELRAVALEERIEADLALGRHPALVPELESLVARHPLRERLRGQLMLALYRSGRQADALEAYRSARRELVDELGIEPGPALQQLEQAILVQHESLAAPAAAEGPEDAEPPPPERKLITVLFLDLGLGADPDGDPERTRDEDESALATAAAEIEAAGGRVEQGIAGALLAVFGAPAAQEDHAERALAAGLAVAERLGERSFRGAVESGEVVAEPGARLSGPPVNAAARLVREAGPGQILVGPRAIAAAHGRALLDDGRVLTGLGQPSAAAPHAFVGRESELAQLAAAASRTPGLVCIVGDAGVGKTSIVGELRRRLGAQAAWLTGRCLPYGRGTTYRPLGEIVSERLRSAEDALVGREILGLTLGHDVGADLDPREARDRLHEAVVAFLAEAAGDGPLIVTIEDVHWAEDPLLDLLERVARDVDGPLLVLATARPDLLERAPGWGSDGTRIRLDPLSRAETDELVRALAGDVPAAVRDLVVERAEGNPFFAEELLNDLRERDAGLAVPDTVQAVLAARIDRLPAAAKAALQAAAVIGRVFWERPLAELTGSDPDLDLLERRDFVRRQAVSSLEGEREYVFKHALTREVAYASLPAARRARLHAGFADWLDQERGELDEIAAVLAHHLWEAVRPDRADFAWTGEEARAAALRERAVSSLRRAAGLALQRYEIEDTQALLGHALELAADDATKAELWRETAEARIFAYDPDGFRDALEDALALEPDDAVKADIYGLLAQYGAGRAYMWRSPPTPEETERWLQSALALAAPGSAARGNALLALALSAPERGGEAAEEATEIAERLDDSRMLIYALEAQAGSATLAGDFEGARTLAERALELAPRVTEGDVRVHVAWHAGFVYLRAGRTDEARRLADEYDRTAAAMGPHHEVHAVGLHALIAAVERRWQTLRELSPRAEAATLANDQGPCQFNWRSLLVCALAYAHLGDEREARRLEELARASVVVGGPVEREPALLRLALLRGDLDAAARILDLLPPSGNPWDAEAPAARLDALVALGDRERVEQEAERFLAGESLFHPYALRALGIARGDRELLRRADAAFAAMGIDASSAG